MYEIKCKKNIGIGILLLLRASIPTKIEFDSRIVINLRSCYYADWFDNDLRSRYIHCVIFSKCMRLNEKYN